MTSPIEQHQQQPPVPALPSPDSKGPPLFSRHQGQRSVSYDKQQEEKEDIFQDAQEQLEVTPDFTSPDGYVVVDSPNSKAKSKGAPTRLPPSIYPPEEQLTENLIDDQPAGNARGAPAFPVNRVKNLPTPPVGPVLPDFEDLMVSRKASRSPALAPEESGVKRKPSVVKKLRDRMVK